MNTKMRVVMAGPAGNEIGGMATVIRELARSSLSEQIDLVVFNTAKQTPINRNLRQAIMARFRLWLQWWDVLKGADIVHIHTCSYLTYFLDAGLLIIARFRCIPVVLHIHGARFDEFLNELSQPIRWLAHWLAKKSDRVIVLSESWSKRLSPLLPGVKLHVIENGVPMLHCKDKKEFQKNNEIINIFFLGNLCQRKGVWDLLEAMQLLPSHAHLILVGGEEDKGITSRLREKIQSYNLTERVNLVGPIYGDERLQWLSMADIFALPSYAEGLPIALLEAMSVGLPVVSSPVGGIPAVVRDGIEGFLVSPGDIHGLANVLTQLLTNGDLRFKMGSAALRRCGEKYSMDRVIKDLMTLYSEIIMRMA